MALFRQKPLNSVEDDYENLAPPARARDESVDIVEQRLSGEG